MSRILPIIICVLVYVTAMNAAYAVSSAWNVTDEISARVIVGDKKEDGQWRAGLHFKLADKWKTYWRTPGDGGLPPEIDWSKSTNIKNVEFLWPAPKRYISFKTIETFAYSKEVIFPILITPSDSSKDISFIANINYAVCDEICIFLTKEFVLNIPPAHTDNSNNQLIVDYLHEVPKKENGFHGLNITSVQIKDSSILEIIAERATGSFSDPDIFIEAGADFRFPKAEIFFNGNKTKAIFNFPFEVFLDDKTLQGNKLTLTLVDNKQAIEIPVLPPFKTSIAEIKKKPQQTIDNTPTNYLLILLSAFIGGLILNIMPCVLPVLSLKLLGILKHAGGQTSYVRQSFFMSTLGIVSSFLLLAFIVASLKTAGTAVGWGFHFQNPIFIITTILILNLFAANQLGLFEIRLPAWLGGRIYNKLATKDDHTPMGNFFTGAFATLLATPCSAPFVGTAISFALSRDIKDIYIIFFVMSLGLAAPYILFTLFPKMVTKMPKPGAWMAKVKHLMGFLLAATSIWLIWVLSHQIGNVFALILAFLSVIVVILLWARQKTVYDNLATTKYSSILILVVLAAIFVPFKVIDMQAEKASISESAVWVNFQQKSIDDYVAQGKVVFVDVTADWCLTCKFNKANVLGDDDIQKLLSSDDIIAMKADYTSPDKAITNFLKANGRYGIPFNIIYGPSAPQGIKLSELLSKSAVLEAIEKAK